MKIILDLRHHVQSRPGEGRSFGRECTPVTAEFFQRRIINNNSNFNPTDLLTFEQSHDLFLWYLPRDVVKFVKEEFHEISATLVVDSAHNLLYEVESLTPHQRIAGQIQMTNQRLAHKTIVQHIYNHNYRRSGNFRVKKLSYDKFSCKKISQERPLTALALIVHANFCKINFRSCHRLRKYFYNENFQIYGTSSDILTARLTKSIPIVEIQRQLKVSSFIY